MRCKCYQLSQNIITQVGFCWAGSDWKGSGGVGSGSGGLVQVQVG